MSDKDYTPAKIENQIHVVDVSVRLQAEASQLLAGIGVAIPLQVLNAVKSIGIETIQDYRARAFIEALEVRRVDLESNPNPSELAALIALDQTDCVVLLRWQEQALSQAEVGDYEAVANQACQDIRDQIAMRAGLEKVEQRAKQINGDDPGKLSEGGTWADIAGLIGPITWAWPKWIANGMLHIIASEPGKGKSALCLRLAACYLLGKPWPDGTPFTGERGKVLWCEAEAGQAVNLERAGAWGLPLDNLLTPLVDPLEDLQLDKASHVQALQAMAARDDVRLIILDSLRGLHSRDENSSETMGVIKWLAELARDNEKPVLLTHHLRKRGMFDLDGIPNLDRLRGSTAITQSARLVFALDNPDPMLEHVARLSVIKSNLAKFPEPVGMIIDEKGVTFTHAPQAPKTESVADKAADLLLALLSSEPRPANEMEAEIAAANISMVSARRAKTRLGIVSIKKDDGKWYWSLPAKGFNDYTN